MLAWGGFLAGSSAMSKREPCGGRHGSATRCGVVLAVFAAAPLASVVLLSLAIYAILGISRRLSQTTGCTCEQWFLSIVSEATAKRSCDPSRRRRDTGRASWRPQWPPRRRGAAAAAAEVLASCLRLSLLAQHNCVTAGSAQLPPELSLRAERGRTASATPADAPKGRRLERPAVAAYGNAIGGLWRDHEETERDETPRERE